MQTEIEDSYRAFLADNGFYPIADNWDCILINHSQPGSAEEEKRTYELIKSHVGKKNGVYVYENADGKIMYIGKGKPLLNRIKSHYNESYRPVGCGDMGGRFSKFFSSNTGFVKVYYKEVEGELNRQIIEAMLKCVCRPMFFV